MAKASVAQAKLLARCWGGDFKPAVSVHGFNDPTTLVCVKRGWLSPTNDRGTYPNGSEFIRYTISADGVAAMATAVEEAARAACAKAA